MVSDFLFVFILASLSLFLNLVESANLMVYPLFLVVDIDVDRPEMDVTWPFKAGIFKYFSFFTARKKYFFYFSYLCCAIDLDSDSSESSIFK